MRALIVVNDRDDWPLEIPEVEIATAREYITDVRFDEDAKVQVINLCRSHRYQKHGYYVSLLAEARGHRPLPSIGTIQDLKSSTLVHLANEELDDVIQASLAQEPGPTFKLRIAFGRAFVPAHERLATSLWKRFQTPLLLAEFEKNEKSGKWELEDVEPLAPNDLAPEERTPAGEFAREYVAGARRPQPARAETGYELAILWDPHEVDTPSNERAIKRFLRAAQQVGLHAEVVDADDYARIAEFDALFIRETTKVNDRSYRFARRAKAEGLVVIDDPDSILRCSNKVFLAELLDVQDIPAPKTMIVHRGNVGEIETTLGLPCVLKQPDSAFSLGVKKAETRAELDELVDRLLEKSDLVVAQEFLPTEFDWRIGIFDRQPIYAAKYFMARRHWQIVRRDKNGDEEQRTFGKAEVLPVEMAPTKVVKAALKAANAIGDGLYGVDLKQVGDKVYVIEVNDNPNIDAGVEDQVLKDELYLMIMRVFRRRIEHEKKGGSS